MLQDETLSAFRCPRWAELPGIPLYMDQVILLVEEALRLITDEGERSVTSTMINNYVKQKLIEPPVKKKYGRPQIAGIIVVNVLKRVLSMPEIDGLYAGLRASCGEEEAYNLFCLELENSIQAVFVKRRLDSVELDETPQAYLRAALAAWSGKTTIRQFIAKTGSIDKE